MILSFKEQFVEKIVNKQKVITIREDKTNRWKNGMSIQFWKGCPRNKGSYPFATGIVEIIKYISIVYFKDGVFVYLRTDPRTYHIGEFNRIKNLDKFVKEDGFDNVDEFFAFFGNKDFEGKVIYWSTEHFKLV